MMSIELLREQNFQLKNEITDLKNAFNLNREILKMLSLEKDNGIQESIFLQIIKRLTALSNQSMLNTVELIQQRNTIKQENYLLNLEVKTLEDRLKEEVSRNAHLQTKEMHFFLQEQINRLTSELLAANQERIILLQELEVWKRKTPREDNGNHQSQPSERTPFERKYVSNFQCAAKADQKRLKQDNRRLRNYIDELENRLFLFIKAHHLVDSLPRKQSKRRPRHENFAISRQVSLLKYALNNVIVEQLDGECELSLTDRFKDQNVFREAKRPSKSHSWPKLCSGQEYEQPSGNSDNEEDVINIRS